MLQGNLTKVLKNGKQWKISRKLGILVVTTQILLPLTVKVKHFLPTL